MFAVQLLVNQLRTFDLEKMGGTGHCLARRVEGAHSQSRWMRRTRHPANYAIHPKRKRDMDSLSELVNSLVRQTVLARGALLLRWAEDHPAGGECVIVDWYVDNTLVFAVAADASKESQQATKPSPGAIWMSCTAYQVPEHTALAAAKKMAGGE